MPIPFPRSFLSEPKKAKVRVSVETHMLFCETKKKANECVFKHPEKTSILF
jgi:hypothetical protein